MFCERLKILRNENKLTQKELAEKLGLNNTSTISKYESGDSSPSIEIVDKLADLFGVTADYLMGRTLEREKDNRSDLLEKLRTNPEYKILFDICEEATPAEIRQIIAFHKAMKATNPDI